MRRTHSEAVESSDFESRSDQKQWAESPAKGRGILSAHRTAWEGVWLAVHERRAQSGNAVNSVCHVINGIYWAVLCSSHASSHFLFLISVLQMTTWGFPSLTFSNLLKSHKTNTWYSPESNPSCLTLPLWYSAPCSSVSRSGQGLQLGSSPSTITQLPDAVL